MAAPHDIVRQYLADSAGFFLPQITVAGETSGIVDVDINMPAIERFHTDGARQEIDGKRRQSVDEVATTGRDGRFP